MASAIFSNGNFNLFNACSLACIISPSVLPVTSPSSVGVIPELSSERLFRYLSPSQASFPGPGTSKNFTSPFIICLPYPGFIFILPSPRTDDVPVKKNIFIIDTTNWSIVILLILSNSCLSFLIISHNDIPYGDVEDLSIHMVCHIDNIPSSFGNGELYSIDLLDTSRITYKSF